MLKILFADDSMTAQNMGKKILTDAGYEVIAVSNGAAAAKKILEQPPDIAILDVHMPGYTGFEVCAKIRSSHQTATMPVLLTVGKMEPYSVEDGARVKADGVIIKPFEASVLLATVRNLAERLGPVAASNDEQSSTMRIEPPTMEEFKDDSYTAWKAETASFETLTEAAKHKPPLPSTPEMSNTPAFAFEETVAVPPPPPPVEQQRATVPMEAPARPASPAPVASASDTQPPPARRYAIDETQPIQPYVDPMETPAPASEPKAHEEFSAVFTPAQDAEDASPSLSVHEFNLDTADSASPAFAVEAASDSPLVAPHTPGMGTLETFEEFNEPISVEPAPGFEFTSHESVDPVIRRDPELEHSGAHSTPDVPVGSAPGLVTSAIESIEVAPVQAAPVVGTASGNNIPAVHQSGDAAAPKNTETPAEAASAQDSHDAAFEKLVSELLAQDPANTVEIDEGPPALEENSDGEQPQSFFSRYIGFGKQGRPGTGTGDFPPAPALGVDQTQPISPEIVQRAQASAPPAPAMAAPANEEQGVSLENFTERRAPANRVPSAASKQQAEAGTFSGIRDFKKAGQSSDGPVARTTVPFTASFEDSITRKELLEVDNSSAKQKQEASSIPAFTASSAAPKEVNVQPRKATAGFEDLSLDTDAVKPFIEPEVAPAPVVPPVAAPVAAAAPIPTPAASAETAKPAPVAAAPQTPVAAAPAPVPAQPSVMAQQVPVAVTPARPAAAAPVVNPEPPVPPKAPAPQPVVAAETQAFEDVHEIDLPPISESIDPVLAPEPAPVLAQQTPVAAAPEPPSVEPPAAEGMSHMPDMELAQQLAAALEQHSMNAVAGSSNGHGPASEASRFDAASVASIITKVLDRMVPEIVRMIASEMEQERSKPSE